ncbi:MAG: hypothetical protein A2812_01330 [Candidatus Staskawiczbacteria bacterium RIFCSPHIGHO2_01_FULL_36_16]|uniref:Protease HtpX homolog n=1 Tax=Candidatus Staskawiczbacteria bacterium RIFCSPHIGHO2_01_FULL_36_16 TaxID=1802200 RepID=A0A1G2HNS0_9BACT|nr:MAG: hypothetical protein A2812_01330 [Candidatus Staskawiczbacteria bacterium RIFCSPHIGHO2_01_FULL_36_16]
MERIDFRDQIARNKRNSFFMIVLIFAVFVAFGYVIAKILGEGYFFIVMIISIIFSLVYILGSYYNSHKIALASVRARPINERNSDEKQFKSLVEGLTLAGGLPMPKLYVMEMEEINAFASGRNPDVAVICVTTGALRKLDKKELEGVLAHELGHIANYDIRYMTIVTVVVGLIAIISELFLRSLWFSSVGNDKDSKSGAIFLIIGIVLAILAPLIVQLVQLSISRRREYTADATAVKFTRYPQGLLGALRKIKGDTRLGDHGKNERHQVSRALAPMFFSNPFRNILSTHPPIEKRIEILERM